MPAPLLPALVLGHKLERKKLNSWIFSRPLEKPAKYMLIIWDGTLKTYMHSFTDSDKSLVMELKFYDMTSNEFVQGIINLCQDHSPQINKLKFVV